jgi:uncharacterized protein YbjT (DUF2867 family)
MNPRRIFIAGGTGYIGRRLIPRLLERGHQVRALVRPGSEAKLPKGCTSVSGNALDRNSYQDQIAPAGTFVHLVGVSHPNPSKAAEFRTVDLVAAREAVSAAVHARIEHFVYVSVAQPAPVMKAYVRVRAECESIIRDGGLSASILRPWYVLGPGHIWPYALIPMYWLLERIPSTREGGRRLGLVKLDQMIRALVAALESPCSGVRVWGGPEIGAALPASRQPAPTSCENSFGTPLSHQGN